MFCKFWFALIPLILVSFLGKGQWKTTFDQGMKLYKSAEEIGKSTVITDPQRKERIRLYTSASEKFIEAKDLGPSIAPRAIVLAASSLRMVAIDQNALREGNAIA